MLKRNRIERTETDTLRDSELPSRVRHVLISRQFNILPYAHKVERFNKVPFIFKRRQDYEKSRFRFVSTNEQITCGFHCASLDLSTGANFLDDFRETIRGRGRMRIACLIIFGRRKYGSPVILIRILDVIRRAL